MAPELALRYDSASSSNGILGSGFSLEGLSKLVRVPSTQIHDGFIDPVHFDLNDRLSLDGQRLQVVEGDYWQTGSKYRAEIDNFQEITRRKTFFDVQTKSGLTKTYGNTHSSRTSGCGLRASAWYLNRVEDSVGNYMSYDYLPQPAANPRYIRAIQYTGHKTEGIFPDNEVEFVYEARPDTELRIRAGEIGHLNKRVKKIVVRAGGEIVRIYWFEYRQSPVSGVSQLTTIREIAPGTGDDSKLYALRPTRFEWRNGSVAIPRPDREHLADVGAGYRKVQVQGDFDGDGRTDFIVSAAENNEYGRAIGDFASVHLSSKKYVGASMDFRALGSNCPRRVLGSGDMDGDGLTDFVLACVTATKESYESDGPWPSNVAIYYANRDGTFTSMPYSTFGSTGPKGCGKIRGAADFNVDGTVDLLYTGCIAFSRPKQGRGSAFRVRPNGALWGAFRTAPHAHAGIRGTSKRFLTLLNFFVAELNGDGVPDLVFEYARTMNFKDHGPQRFRVLVTAHLGDGLGGFTRTQWLPLDGYQYLRIQSAGDFNGDGLTDFFLAQQEGNLEDGDGAYFLARNGIMIGAPYILFSLGNGQLSLSTTSVHTGRVAWYHGTVVAGTGDFNGDGKTDILTSDARLALDRKFHYLQTERRGAAATMMPANATLHLSNGHGGFARKSFQAFRDGDGVQGIGDFNGDGRSQVLTGSSNHFGVLRGPAFAVGTKEGPIDRVTEIENGLGRISRVKYRRPTRPASDADPAVYTKGEGSEYPIVDITPSTPVVTAVSEDTGLHGSLTAPVSPRFRKVLYNYAQARADRTGRGFLGFGLFESYDVEQSISISEIVSQAHPHVGFSREKRSCIHADPGDPGQLLSRQSNTLKAIHTDVKNGAWTPWVNSDTPGGKGDFETIHHTTVTHQIPAIMNCKNRTRVECQTTTGQPAASTGEVISCNTETGMLCLNAEQPDGACNHDYQVRFFCETFAVGGLAFPYISESKELKWELGQGPACGSAEESGAHEAVKTINEIDPHGNKTRIFTVWDEGKSTKQSEDVLNDFTWPESRPDYARFGRVRSTTVISESADGRKTERATTFTYHPKSKLLSSEVDGDHRKREIHYVYDVFGNLSRQTTLADRAKTRVEKFFFDERGRFERCRQNALGHTEYREHDRRFGTETRFVDANTMEALGLVSVDAPCPAPKAVGDEVMSTRYEYNPFGMQRFETRTDGTTTETKIEFFERPPNDLVVYNGAYEVLSSSIPGIFEAKVMDRLGRELRKSEDRVWSARASVVDQRYDKLGRITLRSDPYDKRNKVAPRYNRMEYDRLGRVTLSDHTSGLRVVTQYDGRTTTIERRPGPDSEDIRESITVLDARGRVVESYDALGNGLIFSYGPFGTLDRTTPAIVGAAPEARLEKKMFYDAYGHRTAMEDPDLGYWTYDYDGHGQMISQTDANDKVTTLQYDSLGRLTRRIRPEGTDRWVYDHVVHAHEPESTWLGKLVFEEFVPLDEDLTPPNGTLYRYDPHGREVEVYRDSDVFPVRRIRRYDKIGRLEKQDVVVVKPDGSVDPLLGLRYHHTFSNDLQMVEDDEGRVWYDAAFDPGTPTDAGFARMAYDARDRPIRYRMGGDTDGNGAVVTVDKTYRGEFTTGVVSTGLSGVFHHQALVFDPFGNLKLRRRFQPSRRDEYFAYDALNRLTSTRGTATAPVPTVAYDALGNITYKEGVGDYAYGQTDRTGLRRFPHAVTAVGATSYVYDEVGNMVERGEEQLIYTSFNKARWIGGPRTSTSFAYDGSHRRVRQVVEDREAPHESEDRWRFRKRTKLYMGGGVEIQLPTERGVCVKTGGVRVCESNQSSGVATARIHVSGPDGLLGVFEKDLGSQEGTRRYFLKDHLGSVVGVVSEAGQVVERFDYDAWGERRDIRVVEDAEGEPYRWRALNPDHVDLTASVVEDEGQGSRVVDFQGGGILHPFILEGSNGSSLGIRGRHVFRWQSKFDAPFQIDFRLKTSAGEKYVYYAPRAPKKPNLVTASFYVARGLGEESADGTWKTFTVDVRKDLRSKFPDLEIEEVTGILVRGSGRLDNMVALASVDRGFTSHEMLEAHQLVHMNGRIYDPKLGRFLSADPFVQSELDLQNHNRYTYVLNRPLSFTDPSGYFIAELFMVGAALFEAISTIAPIVAVAMPVVEFGMTYAKTGDIRSAFRNFAVSAGLSLASMGVTRGIGRAFLKAEGLVAELSRATAHGVWQGAYNEISGQGSFAAGALAGAAASLVGHLGLNRLPPALQDRKFAMNVIAGTAGGTAEYLGGGKFANGFAKGFTVNKHNNQAHTAEDVAHISDQAIGLGEQVIKLGGGSLPKFAGLGRSVSGAVMDTVNFVDAVQDYTIAENLQGGATFGQKFRVFWSYGKAGFGAASFAAPPLAVIPLVMTALEQPSKIANPNYDIDMSGSGID